MPLKHRICQQFNSPRGASLGDFRQVPTFSFSERKDTRRESSAYRTGYASFPERSEEHTSELQPLMRISYAVFCLKKKIHTHTKVDELSKSNAENTNIHQK